MEDIKAMFELDFQSVMLALVTFMIGFMALRKVFTEFCGMIGIETKFMRAAREQKEDIDYLKQHSAEQDRKIDSIVESISKMSTNVDNITLQLEDLKKKNNEHERSKLGDRLIQNFRYYNERGQITEMEKWAFDNLVNAYLDAGGDSFIDEKVLPASLTWEIID